jgi:hypothetical protein
MILDWIIGIGLIVIIIYISYKTNVPSACHGNCNQGRNCDCVKRYE